MYDGLGEGIDGFIGTMLSEEGGEASEVLSITPYENPWPCFMEHKRYPISSATCWLRSRRRFPAGGPIRLLRAWERSIDLK